MSNDSDSVWKYISHLANSCEDDGISSLRVLLYTVLVGSEAQGLRRNLRHLLATSLNFVPHRQPIIPGIKHGLPVFLFPYSTGSNLLNSIPVAVEAEKRNLLGGIIIGKAGPNSIPVKCPAVYEQDLYGLVRVKDYPRICLNAYKSFRKLLDLFRGSNSRFFLQIQPHRSLLIRNLVYSHLLHISYSRLFSRWRPSCIISTSDYWPGEYQCYCQAKRSGIPTAMIQHGEFTSALAWPIYADKFLVWGERFQNKLLSLGAAPDRLKICGMPASDNLHLLSRKKIRSLPCQSNPVCLLFSHTHDRFEEPALFSNFSAFLKAIVLANPNIKWVVKLHPAEDDSFYNQESLTKLVEILPRATTLEDALSSADIAFTIRSTAGIQAMIMGIPLLIVDIVDDVSRSVTWPIEGGGLAAKTPNEFSSSLQLLTCDLSFRQNMLQSQQRFLDQSFRNIGSSSTVIVDYLEELSQRSILN